MTMRQPPENVLSYRNQQTLAHVCAADDLVHPELRKLFSLWKRKSGEHAAPSRQNLDVFELKQWLPHIQLVDIIEDCKDVRYRVVGTWLVDCYGEDSTGSILSELGSSEQIREVKDEFLTTARSMTPQSIIRPFYDRNGVKEFSTSERLMLPLSSNGRNCDKVLSAIYYLSADC